MQLYIRHKDIMAAKLPFTGQDTVPDVRNCPQCQNVMKSPRLLLNCFHVLCENCLKDAIKGKKPGGVFQCHVCEGYTTVPWEGVAGFPEPLFVQAAGSASPRVDIPCNKHHKEKISLYCTKCDTAVCHICALAADCHKDHPCVSLSASFAELDRKKIQLGSKVQKLKTKTEKKNNAIAQIDLQVTELASQKTEAENHIDTHCQHLIDMINQQREDMKHQIHDKVKLSQCVLAKKRGDLVNSRNSAELVTKLAEQLVEHASPNETMLHQRPLSDVMTVLESEKDEEVPRTEAVTFVPQGVTEMGSLNIKDKIGEIFGGTSIKNIPKLKLVREFSSKADADKKTPDIEALAVDKNLNIFASDRSGNKNLKMFDRGGNLLSVWSGDDVYQLGGAEGVCCSEDGSVVLCDRGKDQIIFLDSKHRVVRTIKAPGCYGVVVTGDHIMYTSRSSSSVIVLSKRNGRLVREIKYDRQDKHIFVLPFGIAMAKQGHLVVADVGNYCVFVLSMGGELLHRYGRRGSASEGDDCFNDPYGVCVDQFGHILVTDRCNNRIHMLSPDAEFICHLVTDRDGLQYPWGIALDQEGHLIVSEFTGKIKVFAYPL